jgi:predicted O-methyltransferase YrrM
MTKEEVNILVQQYKGEYTAPTEFEHRFDPDSSNLLYALLRKYKPRSCLSIGTWLGGSTCLIMAALLENTLVIPSFHYIASELLDDMRQKTYENCLRVTHEVPEMIGDITKNLDKVPKKLDFLFVDTDHDLETTRFIVKNIFPRLIKGSLVAIHDFAVEEIDGKWIGKGHEGIGGLPETQYYMDLYHAGKWPLKKLYWMYHNPYFEGGRTDWEGSFWEYV